MAGKTKEKKLVKTIKIDVDKCNGCRACEVICSAFHASPKYSSNNPARSRIRIIREPLRDIYVPVYAGEYTMAECAGRDKYTIDGKEYDECSFCRASCPSREEFKEPDSGLPLKCDMCEGEDEPLCVKWCLVDALTWSWVWNLWRTNSACRPSWTPWPACPKMTKANKRTHQWRH